MTRLYIAGDDIKAGDSVLVGFNNKNLPGRRPCGRICRLGCTVIICLGRVAGLGAIPMKGVE